MSSLVRTDSGVDSQILGQLDSDTVDAALALWSTIQQANDTLSELESRLSDAQATLQAAQSSVASVSTPAITDLNSLVKIGQSLLAASESVQTLLGIDTSALTDSIQAAQNALQDLSTLQAATIQGLDDVLTAYDQLQRLQSSGGALALAKAAFADYASQFLNQQVSFKLGDSDDDSDEVIVEFKTALGSQSPFSASANLSATIICDPITVDVTGVSLTLDASGHAIPDFSHVKATVDKQAIAAQIVSNLPGNLPGLTDDIDITLKLNDPQPHIEVTAQFDGIPSFEAITFSLGVWLTAKGLQNVSFSGGLDDFLVPIPPGTFALKGITVGYVDTPQPQLSLTTSIVPTEDGGTGATIAFTPLTALFPLQHLGQSFKIKGDLTLLETFDCGSITATFTSAPSFDGTLDIPASSGSSSSSPFGDSSLFELHVTDLSLDKNGLTIKGGAVKYLTLITGTVNGVIGFNGSGHIDATAGTSFGVDSVFSADWKPGFSTVTITSTASVKVNLDGFSPLTASVQITGTIDHNTGSATASVEVLGHALPSLTLFSSSDPTSLVHDLGAVIKTKCESLADSMRQTLFDKGTQLVARLGATNSVLQHSLASLDPLQTVADAQHFGHTADVAIQSTKTTVERTVTDPHEVVKGTINQLHGLAKKWKRRSSLGLDLVQQISPPPGDATLPVGGEGLIDTSFLSSLDSFLDGLVDPNAKAAQDLAASLDTAPLDATPIQRSGGSGTTLGQVDSRLNVSFDQMLIGSDDIDAENKSAKSSYVAFYLTGTSSTRRGGQEVHASFCNWGHVRFATGDAGVVTATITVAIPEQPLNDASLLHAEYQIYTHIQQLIAASDPSIAVTSLPADMPADPNFDQPPAGKLPVLGTLGIERVAVGNGLTVEQLDAGAAAVNAGIRVGDLITGINGVSLTAAANPTELLAQTLAAATSRIVALNVQSASLGTISAVNVTLDPFFKQV